MCNRKFREFPVTQKPCGQTMRTRTRGQCCFATVLGAGIKAAFSEFYIARVRVNALLFCSNLCCVRPNPYSCPSETSSSVLIRCNSRSFLKYLRKIALAFKSHCNRNINNWKIRVAQQTFRLFNPHKSQIFLKGHSNHLFK